MDGWAKLAAEAGDVFYWVASRVALWGGIFELNYEFSALETLDGQNDHPEQHYYPFEPREYAIDPHKAAFVREVAQARAGWGSAYLAYGTMLRPPEFDAAPLKLDYHLYNCGRDLTQYSEKGHITVPGMVCAAWRSPDGQVAIFFANPSADTQTIQPRIDAAQYWLGPNTTIVSLDSAGSRPLGTLNEPVTLEIPGRRIVALALTEQA
jgi:hypothetical protein